MCEDAGMSTRYDRLARESTDFRHWKLPLAGIVAGFAFFALIVPALSIGELSWVLAGGEFGEWSTSFDERLESLADPDIVGFNLLMIILMIPALAVGVLAVWPGHVRYLHSVAGKIRWRFLWHATGISAVVYVPAFATFLLIDSLIAPEAVASPQFGASNFFYLLIVLLFVPFQAASEEYLVRGYLLQLFSSWTTLVIIPIVATSAIFAALHLYDLWGSLDVAAFGLAAAYLTIRTGGLEAAIAVHTMNNVVIFAVGAFGVIDLNADTEGSPTGVAITIVTLVIAGWLLVRHADRMGLERTRPAQPPRRAKDPTPASYASWHPAATGYLVSSQPLQQRPWQPTAHVPENAPEYPGELTEGWPQHSIHRRQKDE